MKKTKELRLRWKSAWALLRGHPVMYGFRVEFNGTVNFATEHGVFYFNSFYQHHFPTQKGVFVCGTAMGDFKGFDDARPPESDHGHPHSVPPKSSIAVVSHPEFNPDWDVHRDGHGRPVMITDEQVRAIWHAIYVVDQVRKQEGYRSIWEYPNADMYKSRLLGRMLLLGRPPTRTKPPMEMGGPWWGNLPRGDPFE